MSFELAKARRLFEEGRFASISQSVGPDAPRDPHLTAEAKALLAHTCVYTGRSQLAAKLAEAIDNRAPASSRSEAHLVLGLLRKREGRFSDACIEFQAAIRLAREAGDVKALAHSQAHLFRVLADGRAEQDLAALLSDVRRNVTNAGDPALAALLHDSVAAMEAQKGRTSEAVRHLRVARNLLTIRSNAWLEQLVAINASCIALIECDYDRFRTHSSEARSLASVTGHSGANAVMDTNDAHFAIVRGEFDHASSLLKEVLSSQAGVHIELAALEGLARIHLALGQLEECEAVLSRVESLKGNRVEAPYTLRNATTLKAKLLGRYRRWNHVIKLANSELKNFSRVNDTAATVALRLQRALALAVVGDSRRCSRDLFDVGLENGTALREYQAEAWYVCGLVLKLTGQPTTASLFARRGLRTWEEQGNRYGPLDATATEESLDTISRVPRTTENDAAGHGRDVLPINLVASAFNVAYNARLLGEELIGLIRLYELSPAAEIVPVGSTTNDDAAIDVGTAFLGDHNGEQLSLVCQIPDDPLKAIVLSDILRLGEAARALERAREEERNRAALWPESPIETQGGAVFLAEEMQAILATARRVATSTTPVLITGETGTGKEVLARTIHACSKRPQAVFLPFNCASTPKDMLDSQLFGHRRGAFTGAVDHFPGVIRAAAGGTLFLDEIGDMGLDVQPKLLRFLDTGEIHPIGETHPKHVDVRVIVATNADLDALVSKGRFREDLLYRLNIYRIHLPPLRARRVEIPTLAQHYLQKYARELEKNDLRLAEETMEYLVLYKWPGNVRQLAGEMRRLATDAEPGAVLMPEHLSPDLAASRRTIPASQRTLDSNEIVVRSDQPLSAAVSYLEQRMIADALRKCGGRMEETAAMLGLSRKGLYLKRQRFGIEPPAASATA